MKYLIGQVIGVVAAIVSVLNPLYKKKWQMLANNIAINLLLALNLFSLEEVGSGIFLYLVALVQSVINLIHSLRKEEPKMPEKIIFVVLYLAFGFYGMATTPGFVLALNWHNVIELLPIVGAMFGMLFVFTKRPKTARYYLLGCDAAWTLYFLLIGSTAALGNISSIIICLFAMYRYRKQKDEE